MLNNLNLFRYYTSVGIYEGSDGNSHHVIAVRNPDDLVEQGKKKRIEKVLLDEYQFMVWFTTHGEIISEQDMYKNASLLWESDGAEKKKPLFRCCKELMEMGLLSMAEASVREVCIYEISTKIQPYVVSLFDCSHVQKRVRSYIQVGVKTIRSMFLPKMEKEILAYFRENTGTNFFDYIRDKNVLNDGKYMTLGNSVNNLLIGGYIYPVGWCTAAVLPF